MSDPVVQTRGAQIACTDTGADGPVAIFLHYWGGSSRTWTKVVGELAGEMRCISFDQRGWGDSRATDGRYDLDAMADDVEDVAAALKLEHFVLVGHSMGAKVAQIVAARKPAELQGLVLLAPAPPEPMPVPAEQRAAMLASYQTAEGVEAALAILANRELNAADRAQVITDTLAGAVGAKEEWTARGMLATVDAGLHAYAGPVRILVGEHDRVEQPEALREAFARHLPQATIELVPDAGHLLPLERPAAVAAAVRGVTAYRTPI